MLIVLFSGTKQNAFGFTSLLLVFKHLQKNVAESHDLQVDLLKCTLNYDCVISYCFVISVCFKFVVILQALNLGLQTVRFDVFVLRLIDLKKNPFHHSISPK